MSIPEKETVVKMISERYDCALTIMKQKKIMYEGTTRNDKLVVLCTPETKLHNQEHGWFDLSTKQVEILDGADMAIMAVRIEGNKVYFVEFKNLRRLMTADMILDYSKDEKWRFYIWEDHIKVRGNDEKFYVSGEVVKTVEHV
ncbi:hypothetical protein [Exiguobacterium sp. s166]|uniref:hypothetical protein n=1 Tax=Exiguobacterium sp. s166 TaxID=2751204 RepID=UPI001BED16B5|nr:hypothetical protein [Exiguobacterium sp. s166]